MYTLPPKKSVGLIGCGVIGRKLTDYIQGELRSWANLTAICDVNDQKIELFQKHFPKSQAKVCSSYEELISMCDLVVEAASPAISAHVASASLKQDKDVVIMSVGGLVDCPGLLTLIGKGRIYIPSGAIAGIDCINAAAVAGIDQANIITRKPPQGLKGAPYLQKQGITLDDLGDDEERVVFRGSAREAVKAFPKNINVSALLSMASLGIDRTEVQIITSLKYLCNSHEIRIKGPFGEMMTRTDNIPDPENPKTSYLAALSVCALLKKLLEPVKLGT